MRTRDVLILTAVLASVLPWLLWSPPISAHGEAREGLVIQDIVDHGHWILPRRNGELPSKPPLFHWMAAGIAGVLGLSDSTVRAPSALAAWVILLATYGLGAAAGGRMTGWLAAAALLGMPDYWAQAANARVDMVFTACVTTSLASFFQWYRRRSSIACFVCYLAAALAVLAKGPAGGLLPVLVIVAFVMLERRSDVLRELWSWRLAAMAVGIDLGWYALAFLDGGWSVLVGQLVHENVDRFVGRGVFGAHGGREPLFMVTSFLTSLLPWNLALVWAAARWARGEREDTAGRFFHVWWLVVLIFFSLAFGKRRIYLLPLYPAIALLAGRALAVALARADNDERVFGLVPVPYAIRRMFPGRAAIAVLAVAIAVVDLVVVLVGQGVREHRARRASLVGFAAEAGPLTSGGALLAREDVASSDLQVIAYRLRRPIPRASGPLPAPGCGQPAHYLVPIEQVEALRVRGYRSLLTSGRRKANVALVVARPVECEAATPDPQSQPLAPHAPLAQ